MGQAADNLYRIAVKRTRRVFRNIRLNFRDLIDEFGDAALVEEFLFSFHPLHVKAVLDETAWWGFVGR